MWGVPLPLFFSFLCRYLLGVRMVKRRSRVIESEDSSATDSENDLLSASSSVRDDTSGDNSDSKSDTEKSQSEEGGDSSCEEIPISKLVRKKPLVGGGKRKRGEISQSKGKRKVAEQGFSAPKRVKALCIPTRSCLGDASGWLDCEEKFVMSPPGFRREEYFKTYGADCRQGSPDAEVTDNSLNEYLETLEHINRPCNFDPDYFPVLKAAFQIPPAYEVRMPEVGEKIYHRGEVGRYPFRAF